MQRLAEAKGAVEELLAECYVRRDEVGLIAFRGTGAELLLPPTRSLVRAKRVLGKLLGGGGTPLAAGLALALQQTRLLHRRGAIPLVVLLTDGSANVSLAGAGDRAQAREETKTLAKAFAVTGEAVIVVDTSVRGHKLAREIAGLSEGVYLPLPYAQQDALLDQVRQVSHSRRSR
jgi:magnesium chelatase subunit D